MIGALGGSYDVTALSRMLFEDLFNGQGCSMIIAQSGEIIAFEGDTSYWNLDYRDNFYKYCCKWIIKDKVTVKKIKQDFKEGKENLVTADSKKEGTRRHYFAYMPMGANGWMLCYALPEQAAQQSYNFIEDYEISFMIVFIVLVTLLILYIVYENHTRNKELLKYAQTDELKGNNISISIGISTAPQDGDCYMDLYKRADQALYQAKRSGKARVCNYFS